MRPPLLRPRLACWSALLLVGTTLLAQFTTTFQVTTDGHVRQLTITHHGPSAPLVDTDSDGLSDAWETQHFGNSSATAGGDPDGDGLTNLQEYQNGTDPNDFFNAATPVITVLADADGSPGTNGLLQVRITNAGGNLLVNAPVSFAVTEGGSQLAATSGAGATLASSVNVRSGADGKAEAYYRTPAGQATAVTVTAQAGSASTTLVFNPPFPSALSIDFETGDGYVPGALSSQQGWTSYYASTVVEADATAPSGGKVLRLGGGSWVTHPVTPAVSSGLVFFDFYAKVAAAVDYWYSSQFEIGGAALSFTRAGSSTVADVLAGSTGELGGYESTGTQVALDASRTTAWHRYTLRLDYDSHRWDLYLDGKLIAADEYLAGLPLDSFYAMSDVALPSWVDRIRVTGAHPLFTDADHDGMDDAWEIAHGLISTGNDRDGDLDHDGFTNVQEYIAGTDPQVISTGGIFDKDNNGLPDAWELRYFGQTGVAASADPDGDGLPNAQELRAGTDPNNRDTDGDGLSDSYEVTHGRNPLVAEPDSNGNGIPDGWEIEHFGQTGVDPNADPDGDGLTNRLEFQNRTNPFIMDTDGDSLTDGQEITFGTDPKDAASGRAQLIQWHSAYTASGTTEIFGPGIPGFEAIPSGVRYNKFHLTQVQSVSSTRDATGTYLGNGMWHLVQESTGTYAPNPDLQHIDMNVPDSYVLFIRDTFAADGFHLGATFADTSITYTMTNPSVWDSSFTYVVSEAVQPTSEPFELTYSANAMPAVVRTPALTTNAVYHITIPAGLPGPIRWFEVFTPADGSAKQYTLNEWVITNGATQSPSFTLISPANGSVMVEAPLVMTYCDMDIVHPASGEVAEDMEDANSPGPVAGKGGLVAIRRTETTPMTNLVLRAVSNLPAGATYRIVIDEMNAATTGTLNVWQNQARTQAATTQTEFPANAETTLFLEGNTRTVSRDLKIKQQVKVNGTWIDGDSVSTTIVHAEIPVVMRAFIPHAWTDSEPPGVPMELVPLPPPGIGFAPVRTDCIGGNRPEYSPSAYDDEDVTRFKLMQEIIMTPYKQLHAAPDIVGARRATRTDITKYYLKAEDLLPEDRSLTFGERFAPAAAANWEFVPPTPTEFYEEYPVFPSIRFAGASLSGGPGAPAFIWDGFMPNIDFKYKIGMQPLYVDGIPYVHVTLEAEHNLYPAYEVIVGKSDDSYVFIYKNKPTDTTFPGPQSLNIAMTAEGVPTDIQ